MTNTIPLFKVPSPMQEWNHPLFNEKHLSVKVKRDDLIHSFFSGNKYRKLIANIEHIKKGKHKRVMSFGGAYSNHLHAMSGLQKYYGVQVRMIIRGDELNVTSSPTLSSAHTEGVELIFVSRQAYRDKSALTEKYGDGYYIIPEGGSNTEALQGVDACYEEIHSEFKPGYICCSAGTGGTAAGFYKAARDEKIVVVPALKGGKFLEDQICKLAGKEISSKLDLWTDYHFGGYAKHNDQLLKFIESIEKDFSIPLEHVYTGKLFYAVLDKASENYFPEGSKIVVYHSGGLQGKKKLTAER